MVRVFILVFAILCRMQLEILVQTSQIGTAPGDVLASIISHTMQYLCNKLFVLSCVTALLQDRPSNEIHSDYTMTI